MLSLTTQVEQVCQVCKLLLDQIKKQGLWQRSLTQISSNHMHRISHRCSMIISHNHKCNKISSSHTHSSLKCTISSHNHKCSSKISSSQSPQSCTKLIQQQHSHSHPHWSCLHNKHNQTRCS